MAATSAATAKGSVRRGSVEVRQREAFALRLRIAGETFDQIGVALGVSDRMSSRIVRRALDRLVREPAAELVALEAERLDLLWRAILPRAQRGSARHAEVCLRVLERRAKLFGLDAAARVDANVLANVTVEQLDAEIERLLAEYGGAERS